MKKCFPSVLVQFLTCPGKCKHVAALLLHYRRSQGHVDGDTTAQTTQTQRHSQFTPGFSLGSEWKERTAQTPKKRHQQDTPSNRGTTPTKPTSSLPVISFPDSSTPSKTQESPVATPTTPTTPTEPKNQTQRAKQYHIPFLSSGRATSERTPDVETQPIRVVGSSDNEANNSMNRLQSVLKRKRTLQDHVRLLLRSILNIIRIRAELRRNNEPWRFLAKQVNARCQNCLSTVNNPTLRATAVLY